MKLASIEPIANNFIQEMGKYKADDDPEKLDEAPEDELAPEDPGAMGEEPAVDELPPEEEIGDEELEVEDPEAGLDEGEADISLTEEEARLLIDLGERLREAVGAELDDEEMPDEEMSDEEMPAVEDDMPPPEDAMPPVEDEEAAAPPLQENLVNEVLKRVTKRLVREKLKR